MSQTKMNRTGVSLSNDGLSNISSEHWSNFLRFDNLSMDQLTLDKQFLDVSKPAAEIRQTNF